ncbi:30S ribosomal protein S12 methylthiotransferase RimO [Bacteroidota bacterium]
MKRINIITLGCSKNIVDSEVLMGQLKTSNYKITHESVTDDSDVVIINTCGFIEDAKLESIDHILKYAEMKKKGKLEKLYVMGCLSERYKNELNSEIPEVDGFYGVHELESILKLFEVDYDITKPYIRTLTTPSHYAFLKIAEGCDRKCSFCAIPLIRGKHISKSMEQVLAEAKVLADQGVKELILISQDLTYYGVDNYKKQQLPKLIESIADLKLFDWIRLHYLYPVSFPLDLLEVIRDYPVVCDYIDLPFQHISGRILNSMNRGIDEMATWKLIEKIKEILPHAALRSTLICGYPGETDKEYEELIKFVQKVQFDRLGVFKYSHEEGTTAAKLKDDIPEKIKEKRMEHLMNIQQKISSDLNKKRINEIYRVLFDRSEGDYYIGRTQYDAPEIDNEVLVKKGNNKINPGEFKNIRITGSEYFDLYGEVV